MEEHLDIRIQLALQNGKIKWRNPYQENYGVVSLPLRRLRESWKGSDCDASYCYL